MLFPVPWTWAWCLDIGTHNKYSVHRPLSPAFRTWGLGEPAGQKPLCPVSRVCQGRACCSPRHLCQWLSPVSHCMDMGQARPAVPALAHLSSVCFRLWGHNTPIFVPSSEWLSYRLGSWGPVPLGTPGRLHRTSLSPQGLFLWAQSSRTRPALWGQVSPALNRGSGDSA